MGPSDKQGTFLGMTNAVVDFINMMCCTGLHVLYARGSERACLRAGVRVCVRAGPAASAPERARKCACECTHRTGAASFRLSSDFEFDHCLGICFILGPRFHFPRPVPVAVSFRRETLVYIYWL